ncbi:MAG: Trk family potassium uptake protein [Lachnospiraceae bacterium]|nr:Trk family potassium uptake protein [Lachnospiraceae bacterium]
MNPLFSLKKKLTSFQIIILGFFCVILFGAVILMLPVSSREGIITPFSDALFTSTSAVCVTGLVVHDTASYWSTFGQAVIMVLIQIGGMGVITAAVSFVIISGRKVSLMQRSTMQEAISAPKVGGIVRLTGFIVKITLFIELAGAAAMAPTFIHDFGIRGLWMAFFHSISAFCNAGFDLMGTRGEFSSLTSYASSPVINFAIMSLIIIGGIGFLTWEDIKTNRWHWHKYRMQTKVILSASAVLLILPAAYFFFYEFSSLPPGTRILSSLFQSVTPRTAGFNTADLTAISDKGQFITIVLMLIGGSPGSTAGGMKTTTIAVLFATGLSTFSRQKDTHFFGRRIDHEVIRNTVAILFLYLTLSFSGGLIISIIEKLPFFTCLFETASAIGTVGLSLGITPGLGIVSRTILILLMFFGRVGGLTLIFAALSGKQKNLSKLPKEKIMVG